VVPEGSVDLRVTSELNIRLSKFNRG